MTKKKRSYGYWTEEEKEQLREFYPNIGTTRLNEAYPGRSRRSIYTMAARLKLLKTPECRSESNRLNRLRLCPPEDPASSPSQPA